MATTHRRYAIIGLLGAFTFAVIALSNCTFGTFEPYPAHFSTVSNVIKSVDFNWSYAASPAEEIQLQAAIATETPLKEPATLNGMLRSIDIRTALEDTQRLRFELG